MYTRKMNGEPKRYSHIFILISLLVTEILQRGTFDPVGRDDVILGSEY